MSSDLLNLRASALNQNDQHNDKEYAGNYPDNRSRIHFNSPFFRLLEKCFERIHHDDRSRTKYNDKQGWEDEEYEREEKLDRQLRSLFLDFLDALLS